MSWINFRFSIEFGKLGFWFKLFRTSKRINTRRGTSMMFFRVGCSLIGHRYDYCNEIVVTVGDE